MHTVRATDFDGSEIGLVVEIRDAFEGLTILSATIQEFGDTINILKQDAFKSLARFERHPNDQYWRRSLIKNVFAWFEGQAFMMKRIALRRNEHFETGLTTPELVLLSEEKHFLNDRGETKTTRTNYQKFIANYPFAFRCFSQSHGSTFILEQSGVSDLNQLQQVRDRLTHPKGLADLMVSDMEMDLAKTVLQWHVDQSAAAMKASIGGVTRQQIRRIEKVSSRFRAQMPVLMFWKDGMAYEFPTKAKARLFAKARGGRELGLDFTLILTSEVHKAASGV